MIHLYQPGQPDQPTFVLLHGTGGNEHDLLGLAAELNPDYGVLSIRGSRLEKGMPRYFNRVAEGQYDEADLAFQGDNLLAFIRQSADTYHFNLEKIIFVGFSNGANIAINLLLKEGAKYPKALLFHPYYPVVVPWKNDLSQTSVFLTLGREDPIVPLAGSQGVIQLFKDRQARVDEYWTSGHQLTMAEVVAAKEWLAKE